MACNSPVVPNTYRLQGLIDVDNSNIAQGRILVVDQNCIHQYVDPCTILQQCQNLYTTFLSLTDTPNSYSGQAFKILRVNGSGTGIEFVDASTIFNSLGWTDQLVKTQASDPTAGYLKDKITAGQGISTSVVGNTVQISVNPSTLPSLVTTFTQLTDTPNSYSGKAGNLVRVNSSENGLEFVTSNIVAPKRGRRYLTNNEVYSVPMTAPHEHLFVIRGFQGFKGNSSYIQASGITYSSGGNTTNILRVPETGIYRVSFKGTLAMNSGVRACRVALASTNGTAIAPTCDSKFGDQWFNPGDYTDQLVYFDWGKSVLMRLQKDTYIYAILIIYTWFPAGRGPTPAPSNAEVIVLRENVIGGGVDDRGTAFEISWYGTDEGYISA